MIDSTYIGKTFGESGLYARYRPSYPDTLFDAIFKEVTHPYICAVDLGAGTGISSQFLSRKCEKVFAIEPDVRMTKAGRFSGNVSIINSTTEEVIIPKGIANIVISGNAFYWMDAKPTLDKIYLWLRPKGVFAAFRYDFPKIDNKKIVSIVSHELIENWDFYRSDKLKDTEHSYREISSYTKFKTVEKLTIPNLVEWTLEDCMGFFLSTSYVNAFLSTIHDKSQYVDQLKQKLEYIEIEWPVKVDMSLELIIARK